MTTTKTAPKTATLKLSLLGRPEAHWVTETDAGKIETEIDSLRTTKTQALISYLAMTKQSHSRDALATLFWGEDPVDKAKNSLRVALSNLNKSFPNHLEINRETVTFRTDSPHWLDVDEFARRTKAILDSNLPPDPEEMRVALALYRGDFFEDFFINGAPDFETWLLTQREEWRATALDTWELLAETLLEQRHFAAAAQALEHLLTVEPWHEESHRQLMITYSRMGDFNAALAQYATCRQVLADELDVDPMPETVALYERITIARRAHVHKLPADATPFVGREVELAQIANMLDNPHIRLLTIVGFGGMGKTRLALAAARQVTQEQAVLFLNGVYFVPLASLEDANDLPITLADALNVPLSGRARPARELINYLRNQEMLLVLDNFEQLLPGAPLLNQIIENCPSVKLVVTSREPLGLDSEWRLDLQGLVYPSEDDEMGHDITSMQHSAVQLFVHAAQQVRPDFTLNAQNADRIRLLCQLTAGMPLALKLAATWLRVMSLERIVAEIENNMDILSTRMRDVPERQRSMRAIFDYTWRLLTPEEQRVFAALSVFRGGFTDEAARSVTGASPGLLAGLFDRGLVHMITVGFSLRYELHDLTQQYAAHKLHTDPQQEREALDRHGEYYAQFVQRRSQALHSEADRTTLDEVAQEIDNLRACWRHLLAVERFDALQPLVVPLHVFFFRQGWFTEGTDLSDPASNYLQEQGDVENNAEAGRLLAELLTHQGDLYLWQGKNEEGLARLQRSVALARKYQEKAVLARGLTTLAWQASGVSQYDRMMELTKEALAIYAEIDHPEGLALALHYAGTADFYAQSYASAEAKFLESIRVSRAHSLHFRLPHALNNLAIMLNGLGRYQEAKIYAQEAVEIIRRVHNQSILLYPLLQLGRADLALGNLESAHEHLQHSLTLCRAVNDGIRLANVLEGVAEWALLTEDYGEARRAWEESLQINRELGSSRFIAIDLNGLGQLDQLAGDYKSAVDKHRESYQLFAGLGHESGMATALEHQANASLALGDPQAAETFLTDALGLAHKADTLPQLLSILCSWAGYLHSAGHAQRALCLLAYVQAQPAANYATTRRAAALWKTSSTDMDPAEAQAAHAWGANATLAQVLDELPH